MLCADDKRAGRVVIEQIDHLLEQPSVSEHFLLPLDQELDHYRDGSLYGLSSYSTDHAPLLRLPPGWQEPQPISLPYDYLGSHFIEWHPSLKWLGAWGHAWEPRFVGAGSYEIFGVAFEEAGRRRDGIGHQLFLDLDLALTGTERIHVQFRPLGKANSGGSFWPLNAPRQYIDNSTPIPQRWWLEGELQSLFGGWIEDPTTQWDVNFTVGKFPFALHNQLLMNDEITGVVLGKNTILKTGLSNLNVQLLYAFDEVDASIGSADLLGVHLQADYRHVFWELSYLHGWSRDFGNRDTDWFAISTTKLFGPLTIAARAMAKIGDDGGSGDGQLFVLESNLTRRPADWWHDTLGIVLAVGYLNLFWANDGWTPVAGGNFSRLRNLFVLNPLLQIAAGRGTTDTQGAVVGLQMFRHHQDASVTPEFAYERVQGRDVYGASLRWQRKLSARLYLEARGLKTFSSDARLEREGVFLSTFLIF